MNKGIGTVFISHSSQEPDYSVTRSLSEALPLRRLNLSIGDQAQVKAAWLRFPGFTLEPLEQIYRRVDAVIYRYESAGGKFVAELKVNAVGLVTLYPKVWGAE